MNEIFEAVYVFGRITLMGVALVFITVLVWNIVYWLAKKSNIFFFLLVTSFASCCIIRLVGIAIPEESISGVWLAVFLIVVVYSLCVLARDKWEEARVTKKQEVTTDENKELPLK